ncbi:MAG: RICIN domain-containing protein [Streptosporangiaceae bacterium]
MKRLSRLGFNVAVTGLLTAGAIASGVAAASASTVFGSCSAQGDYATCVASGTADRPVTLTVSVTSSPDQDVFVAWDTVCSEGTSAGGSSGSFTAGTPVTRTISHPYKQPDSCIVSADAQLQAGGNSVHVSLSYSRAAAPAAGEVRGYRGMCADDSGNSSALRTKILVWKCSSSDRAQSWTYSNSELVHNGKCMNDKASGGSRSPVILYSCNGAANELWTHNSHGEYVLKAHGGTLCLDDPAYSTRNGTQLIVYTCNNGANQHWSLP